MGDRKGDGQRYFKVTPKGRAPKVTWVWPAEKLPWYYQYALHWILITAAIPLIYLRPRVSDDGWIGYILEVILIFIFIQIILPPRDQYV